MIIRHAVPKQLLMDINPLDPTNTYVYEYRSQCHPQRQPYKITLINSVRGIKGTCTCPFHVNTLATLAANTPGQEYANTWCKHLCAIAADLVDPALQVHMAPSHSTMHHASTATESSRTYPTLCVLLPF